MLPFCPIRVTSLKSFMPNLIQRGLKKCAFGASPSQSKILGHGAFWKAIGAAAIASLSLLASPFLAAQYAENAPPAPLSFEVTSVKHDTRETTPVILGGPDVSRFIATNITVKSLIEFSYDLRDFEISGGPNWIDTEKFDVDGKVEDGLAQQLRKLPHVR